MKKNSYTQENRRDIRDKVWSIFQGDFMEKYLNRRSMQWFVAVLIFMLFSVYNNFSSVRDLSKINNLKKELTELRLEKASLSSTLMGEMRISVIEERVKNEQLEIAIPKNPPILIKE